MSKDEDEDEDDHCCSPTLLTVDTHMLPSKITFAVVWAGLSHKAYRMVFFTSVGLTSSEAGTILGLSLIVTTITSPLVGMLADYTKRRKLIFMLLCVVCIITTSSLPWVAYVISPMGNKDGGTNSGNVSSIFESPGSNSWNHMPSAPFTSLLFYSMFLLSLFSMMSEFPLKGMLDSIVMNIVENSDKHVTYGAQRNWAALSYGTTNVIAGYLSDKYQIPGMSKFAVVFLLFLFFEILIIPLGFVLFRQTNWERGNEKDALRNEETDGLLSNTETEVDEFFRDDLADSDLILPEDEREDTENAENVDNQPRSPAISRSSSVDSQFSALQNIFTNIQNIVFFTTVLVAGLCQQVAFSFLFLLMKDEMSASHTGMGVASFVGCFSEFLVMGMSGVIIRRIGAIHCLQVGLFGIVLRLLLSSYIKNQWLVAIPEFIQGPSYALIITGSIEYIRMISRDEIYVTMYTVLTSLSEGVAGSVGTVAGSFVYHQYGGPPLYLAMAVFGTLWSLVMFIYFDVFIYWKRWYGKSKV